MAEEEPGILKNGEEQSHHVSPAQPASRLDVGDAGVPPVQVPAVTCSSEYTLNARFHSFCSQ